ncbi:glycosyltransferase family 2 protein [Algoriphagus lutimaris]|uniref:glycosyltransferase n=1 Tax=Algoriphagus lutimaris TaxID=613197 RepID=UPI00196A3B78|nr:glycosyltransferase family A protein [Algoriphagus lutimaris]MBN3518676.1 glycosyltransferase family 2 protein [Algoriphagus lutimaris]
MIVASVIIPTYRSWDYLSKCLEALEKQSIPKTEFEILVINNNPDHSIPKWLKMPDNAALFLQSEPGSYACRNMGLKYAKGKFIAFTDSDCIPEPDWLERGIQLLNQGYDLVGGKMEFFKPNGGNHLAFIYEQAFSFNQFKNVTQKGQSVTANLICKKSVIEKIGKFNETLMSGGDFEWTKRATNSGFKMGYGHDVVVAHPSRKNLNELIRKKKRTIGGMYSRFYKFYTPKQKLFFGLHFIRPHVSIFTYPNLSFTEKTKLFFATWYIECIGMKEMLKLDFGIKKVERE